MSSSTTIADLCTQLRLSLESSPDAVSTSDLLAQVDAFTDQCSASSESSSILSQLEDELQVIYDDVLGHALFPQAEVFLAFLHRLKPILPSRSIISTWFDLVLRPTLRAPKLSPVAVEYAKDLIINALDPSSNFLDAEDGSVDLEKQKERVGDFRRRLMDLYLLDAFNESSGEDVLEWAELSAEQRENKSCWKANLEDVLVRVGNERPQDFLTELYHCFASPRSRVQLLILLNAYTSQSTFPEHAPTLASHPLMTSLLHCLLFDTSSTACTIALSILIKLLPIFAVRACDQLKSLLPLLLVVMARILCWRGRQPGQSILPIIPDPEDSDEDDAVGPEAENSAEDEQLPSPDIREDIEWERLEMTFEGPQSKAPSAHRYFTFLYYLFPCNTIRFLRFPVGYLNDNALESLYVVDWGEALDEQKIRSKCERLLRMHVLHPLLVWRDAREELEQPDFWAKYDVPQIIGGATMLDVRHAALGLREQERRHTGIVHPIARLPSIPRGRLSRPQSRADAPPDAEATEDAPEDVEGAPLSSSLDTIHAAKADPPTADVSSRLRVSLTNMVATSVALRSGLDVEVVDPSPAWSAALFPLQSRTRSPSKEGRESSQPEEEPADAGGAPEHEQLGDGTIPPHVAQAIAALQREVLLLRNDLNLELWTARENVRHIGRLYKERVLSRNEEVERQGLHSKLKEYKRQVTRLQHELKEEKEQAAAQRSRYTDWNKELQDRIAALRAEKKTWTSEAATMRAAEKEAKDTFAAQGKLLAEATNAVFRLETRIKENAHKVDRLYDYETQIDQLMKLQRLWESDVQKLNDSKEYLAAFASKYKKMELRLDTDNEIRLEMEAYAAAQRQQLLVLESQVEHYKKELETSRRRSVLNRPPDLPAELRRVQKANEKLRNENSELRDEVEELQAMLEVLKARGRTGLVDTGSPHSSPLLSPVL